MMAIVQHFQSPNAADEGVIQVLHHITTYYPMTPVIGPPQPWNGNMYALVDVILPTSASSNVSNVVHFLLVDAFNLVPQGTYVPTNAAMMNA